MTEPQRDSSREAGDEGLLYKGFYPSSVGYAATFPPRGRLAFVRCNPSTNQNLKLADGFDLCQDVFDRVFRGFLDFDFYDEVLRGCIVEIDDVVEQEIPIGQKSVIDFT